MERRQRPPEERIRQQIGIPTSNSIPLSEQPLEELHRIEDLLTAKKPYTKSSHEHIESSLRAVRHEIARRPTLTYRIEEVYPPGSIPLKSLDSD